MAAEQPFYFAWVDPTATTFSSAMYLHDEEVLSFNIDHTEGSIPQLTVDVRNPHIGLLAPGRKVYAWFSWDDGAGTVTPLFFGRIIGIPDNIIAETVTLRFTAEPIDFIPQKQRYAETLKVLPWYDPIFLDFTKRDNPDAILEGYSSLWHVDRLTGVVTTSDICVGEDGTLIFDQGGVFYDSLKFKLEQPPLVSVYVDASVTWTQASRGYLPITTPGIASYTGGSFVSGWPKPLTSLGSGWTVLSSSATDGNAVEKIVNGTTTYTYQNTAKKHNTGDVMTINETSNFPVSTAPLLSAIMTEFKQDGLVIPFTVDADGNPDPTNIPAKHTLTQMYVPLWAIGTSLIVEYDAARRRSERLFFLLQADTQPVLVDPHIAQNTETLSLPGADVGEPILELEDWSSLGTTPVALGTLIFPDNPTTPGQTSTQAAVDIGASPHTVGTVEPTFSNVAGATTVDGDITWASLGATQPPAGAPDWTPFTPMPLGAMILPRRPVFARYEDLSLAGALQIPPIGFQASLYMVVSVGSGATTTYHFCIFAGVTDFGGGPTSAVWGTEETNGGIVTWASLGTSLPLGNEYFICTAAGTTQVVTPPFVPGSTFTEPDGGPTWTSIGVAPVPVGGWPGNTPRRSYFPSDRGLQSVAHAICRGRALLRKRSRAAEVSFETRFENMFQMSCRVNATVMDPRRLPGGTASGKVIAYQIIGDGDSGRLYGKITIGCTIGNGSSTTTSGGTAEYVSDGYTDEGYELVTGQIIDPTGLGDVGFVPPVEGNDDDGLIFPLTDESQVVLANVVHGSAGAQAGAIQEGFVFAKQAANSPSSTNNTVTLTGPDGSTIGYTETYTDNTKQLMSALLNQSFSIDYLLSQAPMAYELQLRPVTNGPFVGAYTLPAITLNLPKTIDLAAPTVT